jgi:TolA-binding protein
MKKIALAVVIGLLISAVSGAAVMSGDKDFESGLKAYHTGNFKAAVTHFKEYINKKPDPTAYYLIGYSLYEQGKFSEASEYFRQAFFIDPDFSFEKVGLIKKTGEGSASK